MCGIIAVVRKPNDQPAADVAGLCAQMDQVVERLALGSQHWPGALVVAADILQDVDASLRGVGGLAGLLADPTSSDRLAAQVKAASGRLSETEQFLDESGDDPSLEDLEGTNAALLRCKDALWAIGRDRVRAATGVLSIHTGELPGRAGQAVLLSLHQALSALDRLEVRGRDSAGIEVQLTGHDISADSAELAGMMMERESASFTNRSVRLVGDVLVIVYKVAAEIGELGDNTAALRRSIREDRVLAKVLESAEVQGLVLGHTRWASIGVVSEPNAHPQSSDETALIDGSLTTAVLNGDVDNYAELISEEGLSVPAEITTDAKVIPTLHRRAVSAGVDPTDAFRETVARLEGSVAIAATTTAAPGKLELALRGSGQAIYVGMAEDLFIVASEPYGVVEETDTYLRMDGETPSDPTNPAGSRGQVIELSMSSAGTAAGVRRYSYDGTELPVTDADFATAEITTRDIDRGDYPHFLLKEISDSPTSFRTTLRGRLLEVDGDLRVHLREETLPIVVRERLAAKQIQRVLVIGQGTAAIAGQSLAYQLEGLLADTDVRVQSLPATELSGFKMRADMSDTLIVAISQSGTTTDTNRTVDLVRSRGAQVISIVNRRGSDLTDKSDGVMYTSDGRDVEMSVASTKAFYSQVAAGILLAFAIAEHVEGAEPVESRGSQDLLRALRDLPALMQRTLERRADIAATASDHAPGHRYWAIVGNGVNQIAARELRIKLSELCYKSIACDATEDKKHIDLSAEPMILVCAAGLVGSTADDVAKEIEIFSAHKAVPVVIASEGGRHFGAAASVIVVPRTDERLAFVLATMVGHLFGYEAALAIDAAAKPLREASASIDEVVASATLDESGQPVDAEELLRQVRPLLTAKALEFAEKLDSGVYNGQLEASTSVRATTLLRYAIGMNARDTYQVEFGSVGTAGVILEELSAALTTAIDELTRPVDAIKHQAKTVTVGISRGDESLLQVPLVAAVMEAGAGRDVIPYSSLRSLAEMNPAVISVDGFVHYGISGGIDLPTAELSILDRSGVGSVLSSRVDNDPRLRGTKALVAREKELMVALGRSDGRSVVIVPEIQDGVPVGLVLLHVTISDRLAPAPARAVLQGYRRRYQALRDAVTETDEFDEAIFAEQPMIDLLTVPILDLADRWRP